ncbi:hypothetical protein KBC04_00655 [Candidatus Babeliales bacterium]|nr:hypothetical protein [Candidatus Babeliales bacterium]MBP9843398.1 hypothetical protein [Candidatus Babeliales bacterium]
MRQLYLLLWIVFCIVPVEPIKAMEARVPEQRSSEHQKNSYHKAAFGKAQNAIPEGAKSIVSRF